jgi:hypothetical protein
MNATHQTSVTLRWIVFLSIAVIGLFYVRWFPYYNKAFLAAANHSIGNSILMGNDAAPPRQREPAVSGNGSFRARRR